MNTKNGRSYRGGARLGQHFLTAPSIAQALARAAGIKTGDTVLEIGPGTGMLTKALLEHDVRVIAIEKDSSLVDQLAATFREEIAQDRLVIVHADIRDITPEKLGLSAGNYVLAANIPYYITGEIVRMFLSAEAHPRSMALLIQKEVAERIAREKKESLLSLSVKVYGTPVYVQTVRAGSFNPPPKVDSAILAVHTISKKCFISCTESTFFTVLRAGFASKRKFLAGNLLKLKPKESVSRAFGVCAIPEKARSEDVSLEEWLCLATELQ